MAKWKEVETAVPDLAGAVRARFEATKHHVLATLRKDGSPRVSGTEVAFDGDEMQLGSMPDAAKARDLRHDGRFTIHANPGDGSMRGGDGKVTGTVIEVPNEGSHLFRLDIREVVHTTVENDQLVIRWWTPDSGLCEIRRT
ncbi:pyridoxamine 5'-phosphate oxidase family protein [Nocardia mexicana]|uniref:Pyridoxamine 5'-phosphate oxidase n=1 Tax=Nocardia mexicana TaxID=279262 RepID=A0A370H045_9NOCA|nr:pyridoxamine 5'-phosphate oxidase family protein [Nocardia mexicana]RDI49258.1 pyridoxamine 5'-phosphate oxidase [Nocardia mexicana]